MCDAPPLAIGPLAILCEISARAAHPTKANIHKRTARKWGLPAVGLASNVVSHIVLLDYFFYLPFPRLFEKCLDLAVHCRRNQSFSSKFLLRITGASVDKAGIKRDPRSFSLLTLYPISYRTWHTYTSSPLAGIFVSK
jgi:hypothetical protein